MKKWILPLVIAALIAGAIIYVYFDNKESNSVSNTKTDMLRALYDKCSKLELPFEYSDDNNFVTQNARDNDTLFLPKDAPVLGVLQDTSHFFAFLYLAQDEADGGMLTLITYDKKGNKLSEQYIERPCGEADCGDYQCTSTTTIGRQDSIFINYNESYGNCDDEGNPVGVQVHHETGQQKGMITTKGKIRLQRMQVRKWDDTQMDTLNRVAPQAVAPGDSQ